MDFALTEEQKMLKNSVKEFIKKECPREYVRKIDEERRYPHELYDKMLKLGWMGLPFAEEYGGSSGNAIDLAILFEELGAGVHVAGVMYLLCVCFGGTSINDHGTEEQKREYLPKLINDGMKFSLSYTEPDAGSDLASASTTAVKDGDYYILNGSKMFTSGAQEADRMLVLARTDKNLPPHKGLTTFLVDARTPGIEKHRVETLGHRGIDTNEVFYTDVRVPEKDILGSLNQGWKVVISSLNIERMALAAMAVGNSQLAINDALEYAKERVQFGQPIGKFQVIQHMLADMQIRVNAARLLTYELAWMVSEGMPASFQSAAAKAYSSEVWMDVATKGIQILGGYGYTMDYDMQRYFRDAKLYEIGAGTNQIQKDIIAKLMGL